MLPAAAHSHVRRQRRPTDVVRLTPTEIAPGIRGRCAIRRAKAAMPRRKTLHVDYRKSIINTVVDYRMHVDGYS
jgi:hypothetical protein